MSYLVLFTSILRVEGSHGFEDLFAPEGVPVRLMFATYLVGDRGSFDHLGCR